MICNSTRNGFPAPVANRILASLSYTSRFLIILICAQHLAYGQVTQPPGIETVVSEKPADYSHELPRLAPLEPDQALSSFTVVPGYRMELVAVEPLIASPVAVAWDASARMYVVEMRGYSEHREDKLSQIRLLTDRNDDGIYDHSSIFAEQLAWPTAIACWQDGVFVADAPDILYLKDTNADGIADIRRVVYTGFGIQNVQGLLNTLLWTLDNRIHGSASSNGGSVVQVAAPESKPVALGGRDFSFDPAKLDLRAEHGGAQHGVTFDDWGHKFVTSNSDHAQQVLLEARYLARNPLLTSPNVRISIAADGPQAEVFRRSPIEPWRLVRTRLRVQGVAPGPIEGGGRASGYFTGASGGTLIRGNAFTRSAQNWYIVGDVGSNLIHRKSLTQQGMEFVAERIDKDCELVASTDNWFRPAQFANGPDGCLYIVDVYREVIEHPLSLPESIKQHLDLDSGRDRGRIYRLCPIDFQHRPVKTLDTLPSIDLVSLLGHDNAWHRETASRLLYERQDKSVTGPLEQLAGSPQSPAIGRLHAMYTLAGLQSLSEDLLHTALNSAEPGLRVHAIRLSESMLPRSTRICQQLNPLVSDPNIEVRVQLACTAGYLLPADKVPILATLLANDGNNPWLVLACMSSLADDSLPVLTHLLSQAEGTNDDKLIIPIKTLAAQIARSGASEAMSGLVQSLHQYSDRHKSLCTLALTEAILSSSMKSGQFLDTLSESSRMIAEPMVQNALEDAKRVATDELMPELRRIAALQLLVLSADSQLEECLKQLLSPNVPPAVQAVAIRELVASDAARAAETIVPKIGSYSPEMRRIAIDTLIARPASASLLISALDDGRLPFQGLAADQLQLLKAHPNEQVREKARALATKNNQNNNQEELFSAFVPAPTIGGNIANGKQLAKRLCTPCHRVDGAGHEIGPNLAAAKNRGAEALLINIIAPNREINPQYSAYSIVTKSGETFTGLLIAESESSITLKRAGGDVFQILRRDIDLLQATGASLMPEGLEKDLDVNSMADLLAYLMSLE